MSQRTPRTRTYRLPTNVAARADALAVVLTAHEQRPVDRQEVLERAVDLGFRALTNPTP